MRKKIQAILFTQTGYGVLAGLVVLGVIVSCGGGDAASIDASTDGTSSGDTSNQPDTAQNNDTGQQDTSSQDQGSQDGGPDISIDNISKPDTGLKDVNAPEKG